MKPHFLVLLCLLLAVQAFAQQPEPMPPMTVAQSDLSPAISSLIRRGLEPWTGPTTPASQHKGESVLLDIDLDSWRRAEPDSFVPGPLNGLFGAWGLADARDLSLVIRSGADRSELLLRWRRRQYPPETDPAELILARRFDTDDAGTEFWTLEHLGLVRIVPGCVRSWAALVQESDQQSRLGADRWIRRNSGVLRAIDRASDTMQLVVQPSGQPVVIIRMKPATRQLSVMRAIEQMVPPGTAKPQELAGWYRWVLPTVSINDTIDLQPTVDVGTVAEAVVIVLSTGSTDSDAIKQQLGR